MKKNILCYGNPVYDIISTPALKRTDRVLSGCSTNACLAVSKMNENSSLVGTISNDYLSKMEADLKRWGIEYELLPSEQTGGFSLIYDAKGDRDLQVLGVANSIPVVEVNIEKADFVLLGPILGEISVELGQHISSNTKSPILLDPQGTLRQIENGDIVHHMTDEFVALAGLSTIVKANELETRVVTSIDPRQDPERAVKALYEFGCKIAVVTLAEAGSIIFDGSDLYEIPPHTTTAIDPTGAGDTYAAGFMVKYLETPNNLSAVGCFASAVASVMVENSGPDFPLTRTEADRRFEALYNAPRKLKL